MSAKKRQVRRAFRDGCFRRDGYRCVACGFRSSPARAEEELDAHHITDRAEMPHGGYVVANGVTLCKVGGNCHALAERFHATGTAAPGFSPAELYGRVGSSYEEAVAASRGLA